MNFALPLNQMLALVSRGLCNSQVVTVFFGLCIYWLQTLVSCGGCYEIICIKEGRGAFASFN
jgi:hypothetical protein